MNDREQLKKIFLENWSSVFFTILGKEVKLKTKIIGELGKEQVLERIGGFKSFFRLDNEKNNKEKFILATSVRFVSIVANLMIGMDSFKEELSEDDIDAFKEAINQMFASCVVPINDTYQENLKFSGPAVMDGIKKVGDLILDDVEYWQFEIEIQGVSNEEFVLLIPTGFLADSIGVNPSDEEQMKPSFKPDTGGRSESYQDSNIEMLLDVELPIMVRIGTTEMKLIDIMSLGIGSMIELNKLVDDPVEVLVNNILIARGEVVVYDGNFAIRILEVKSKAERLKSLA